MSSEDRKKLILDALDKYLPLTKDELWKLVLKIKELPIVEGLVIQMLYDGWSNNAGMKLLFEYILGKPTKHIELSATVESKIKFEDYKKVTDSYSKIIEVEVVPETTALDPSYLELK